MQSSQSCGHSQIDPFIPVDKGYAHLLAIANNPALNTVHKCLSEPVLQFFGCTPSSGTAAKTAEVHSLRVNSTAASQKAKATAPSLGSCWSSLSCLSLHSHPPSSHQSDLLKGK